ncbi:speedy protein E2B-like isoform X3 [Symphalangus syndactylus]|uniref:speedy protein E2B-like isoform X3 n=1 Tax=Symphalangus syndactylus TaxID=9590 RepID=UPI003007C5C5
MGNIMTCCLPHPQDEQSPQRSTSGYPLQEVVDDKVSGPSAPGGDHSPPRRSFCLKRKKECSDESEESSEEPQKELKRQRVLLMLPEHHEAFNRLLGGTLLLAALLLPRKPCTASHADICSLITEDPVIKRFLAWDKDLRVSDKVVWDLSPRPQSGRSPEAPGPSTLSSLGQFSAWHTKDPPDTIRPRHTPSRDPIGVHHPGSITKTLPLASRICIRPSNTPPPCNFHMSTVTPTLRSLL